MSRTIEEAKEFLSQLNGASDEEKTAKKIRMVLIREFLEDTKKQIQERNRLL